MDGVSPLRSALWEQRRAIDRPLRALLIGPYDPNCGEYTFLSPPLGVWRLCGHLEALGHQVSVFDPNNCRGSPPAELASMLAGGTWDLVGISTTGMTLKYDLELAYVAQQSAPDALIVAGGMEATFRPELIYSLAPVDLVVLGEGERPLGEILDRLRSGATLVGIPGTAVPLNVGGVQRFHGTAMTATELRGAIAGTPYDRMPYSDYWQRLERAYRLHELPGKAEREARLAEIRSVRLITLNYCPMACSFCSSTNFLHSAQGHIAKVARLEADECLAMIQRIVSAQPAVRTIIFQDDIFVFTNDRRIDALCEGIQSAKASQVLPAELQFISTNRIDAMSRERLSAMRRAGFRVVGFGVESFSPAVLTEFNKSQIHRHIEPTLGTARELGLTPFLDLILTSPRSKLEDVADTVRGAYRWIMRGCEIGLYPYVIPFSGARMAEDPALKHLTTYASQRIGGTDQSWLQPEHILPADDDVRDMMRHVVARYSEELNRITEESRHVPSRARALLWIACAIPALRRRGLNLPDEARVREKLFRELPMRSAGLAPAAGLAERVA